MRPGAPLASFTLNVLAHACDWERRRPAGSEVSPAASSQVNDLAYNGPPTSSQVSDLAYNASPTSRQVNDLAYNAADAYNAAYRAS